MPLGPVQDPACSCWQGWQQLGSADSSSTQAAAVADGGGRRRGAGSALLPQKGSAGGGKGVALVTYLTTRLSGPGRMRTSRG